MFDDSLDSGVPQVGALNALATAALATGNTSDTGLNQPDLSEKVKREENYSSPEREFRQTRPTSDPSIITSNERRVLEEGYFGNEVESDNQITSRDIHRPQDPTESEQEDDAIRLGDDSDELSLPVSTRRKTQSTSAAPRERDYSSPDGWDMYKAIEDTRKASQQQRANQRVRPITRSLSKVAPNPGADDGAGGVDKSLVDTDGTDTAEIPERDVIKRDGTPPPNVDRSQADWISDHAQGRKFTYSNKLEKTLPSGFDWQSMAEQDPHLQDKFCSFTDTGLGNLINEYNYTAPPVPECVQRARAKQPSGMRWGEWFFQRLIQAIREGTCEVKNRAEGYVRGRIVWRTRKQRALWAIRGIQWPYRFTEDKKLDTNSYFAQPRTKSVRTSELADDSSEAETDDSRKLFRPTSKKRVPRNTNPSSLSHITISKDDADAADDADGEQESLIPNPNLPAKRKRYRKTGSPMTMKKYKAMQRASKAQDDGLPDLHTLATKKNRPGPRSSHQDSPPETHAETMRRLDYKILEKRDIAYDPNEVRRGSNLIDTPVADEEALKLSPTQPKPRRTIFDRHAAKQPGYVDRSGSEISHKSDNATKNPTFSTQHSLPARPEFQAPANSVIDLTVTSDTDQDQEDSTDRNPGLVSDQVSTEPATTLDEMGKEKADKEVFSFNVTKPMTGWGVDASANAPKLPEGRKYWTKAESADLENGEQELDVDHSKDIPSKAPTSWVVFSYIHNTSKVNRDDESWQVPPGVLLDESAIFVVTQAYQAKERYKRWPYTFGQNGLPRLRREVFGLPPVVLTGAWEPSKSDPSQSTFVFDKYYYLGAKRQHILKGIWGRDNAFPKETWNQSRSDAQKDPSEWSFGFESLESPELDKANESENLLMFYYVCDPQNPKQEYSQNEISVWNGGFWSKKMIEKGRAPCRLMDDSFTNDTPGSSSNRNRTPKRAASSSTPSTKTTTNLSSNPVRQMLNPNPNESNTKRSSSLIPSKRTASPLAPSVSKFKRVSKPLASSQEAPNITSRQPEMSTAITEARNWLNSFDFTGRQTAEIEGIMPFEGFGIDLIEAAQVVGAKQEDHAKIIQMAAGEVQESMNEMRKARGQFRIALDRGRKQLEILNYLVENQPADNALKLGKDILSGLSIVTPKATCVSVAREFGAWYDEKKEAFPINSYVSGSDILAEDLMVGMVPRNESDSLFYFKKEKGTGEGGQESSEGEKVVLRKH